MFFLVYFLNWRLSTSIWSFSIEILVGIIVYGFLLILLKPTSLKVIKDFLKKENL
ncbi:hypothetical protein HCY21_10160 [Limosilactobacillus fermentum]